MGLCEIHILKLCNSIKGVYKNLKKNFGPIFINLHFLFYYYCFLSLYLSLCPSFLMMCYLNYKFTFDIRTEMVLTEKKKTNKKPSHRIKDQWAYEQRRLVLSAPVFDTCLIRFLSLIARCCQCVLHSSEKHRWRHNFLSFLKHNSLTWCIREAFV